jgi:uncharacterized protein YndB with AHSA1/START domain
MITKEKTTITVEALIDAPVEKVWELWTDPKHIVKWNNASDDWHSPRAENELREGGRFSARMESRDGSQGFDFSGVYNKVEFQKLIEYTLDDGRRVKVSFSSKGDQTRIKEIFEAEQTNSMEMQYSGWQAIMDNFKRYAEEYGRFKPLHFEVLINASGDKVYRIMLDKKHYSDWTSEFNPDSHYKGSWEKGSKILFIGTDKDGRTGGMVSRIKENIPGRFVSIEHVGILKDGREISAGSEIESWAGALENYTFSDQDGTTLLSVDCDTAEEFVSYFSESWPRALNRLKKICEES